MLNSSQQLNPDTEEHQLPATMTTRHEDSEYSLGTQDTYSVNEDEPTQSDVEFEVCDEGDDDYCDNNESTGGSGTSCDSSSYCSSKFSVTQKDLKKITSKNELQDMLLRAQERVIEIQVRIEELAASPERSKTRSRTRASQMSKHSERR